MYRCDLQNDVEVWEHQFSLAINYLESIVEHTDTVDSSLTELIEDYKKLEEDVNIQTAALKELVSVKNLKQKDTKNLLEKRVKELSMKTKRASYSGAMEYLFKKLQTKIDNQNTEGDLVVESVRYSRKDHISKKDIEIPIRNVICKHVYDKDTVTEFINECRKSRRLCQCPVPSCKNKKKLDLKDMESYPDFFNFLID